MGIKAIHKDAELEVNGVILYWSDAESGSGQYKSRVAKA
jgi:hypothetical protein